MLFPKIFDKKGPRATARGFLKRRIFYGRTFWQPLLSLSNLVAGNNQKTEGGRRWLRRKEYLNAGIRITVTDGWLARESPALKAVQGAAASILKILLVPVSLILALPKDNSKLLTV